MLRRIFTVLFKLLVFTAVFFSNQIDYYLDRLNEDPENTYYLSGLGWEYEQSGEYRKALEIYRKCMKLEPDTSKHYLNTGRVYLSLKRPDLSKAVLKDAVYYFPENFRLKEALARAEYELGNFSEARKQYLQLIQYEDYAENAYIYQGLAKTCRELKKYSEADAYFRKSAEINENFWIYYEWAKNFEDQEKYDDAAIFYRKAEGFTDQEADFTKDLISKKIASCYYYQGMKYKDNGNKYEAKDCFRKIINDAQLKRTEYGEKAGFWIKRL